MIRTESVSETDAKLIGITIAEAVKSYFSDQKNVDEFNAFMEQRRKSDGNQGTH